MTNQPKQFASSPLAAVCSRHRISLSQLSDLCGGAFASRTTVHRLLRNELSPDYTARLYAVLAESLPKFLAAKGVPVADIDRQMLEIFERGEYQPMISQRLELSPQAVKFFGLSEDPFTRPPRSRGEVFISPQLQQIIDRVLDAVRYQGFISVTGEIGSGKSTIRALIEDHVAADRNLRLVWPEFFDMRNVTPMQIAESILQAFDAAVPRSSVRRGRAVKDLLSRLYTSGTRVAIAFDECHRLNDSALSSLKNFLEMSSGGFQRYLGVILFGQTVFQARLRDGHFRELLERIVPVTMPDFSEYADAYLAHRVRLVGGDPATLFDDEAIDLICRQATTPLALGNIANESLMISMEVFNETRVIGSAIKTKMFFENQKDQQEWTRRKTA